MRNDDDIWFDSLGGSAVAAAQQTAIAASAVRAAILARHAAENLPVADQNLQRESELVARARAEGLLPRKCALPRRPGPAWLAAAAIGAIGVGLTLLMHTNMPASLTRGNPTAIARIHAEDPKRLQQELIQELHSAGVRASAYEAFGRQGIDADLPNPLPPAVRGILAHHGIAEPADNVLQVEIDTATP